MLIYDSTTERFKLRPRGRTSPLRTRHRTRSYTCPQVRHPFRFFFVRKSMMNKIIKRNSFRFYIFSTTQKKPRHDSVLHTWSGQCEIWWLLQAPVQVEGKHLQAALQRAAGVLSGLCLLQCGLQVNLLILKGKFGFFEVGLYVFFINSQWITYSRGGQHAQSLERQQEYQRRKLSNVLLLKGSAAKCILDT